MRFRGDAFAFLAQFAGEYKGSFCNVVSDTRQEIATSFDIRAVIYYRRISVEPYFVLATVNSSRRSLMTGLAHFISALQFVFGFGIVTS